MNYKSLNSAIRSVTNPQPKNKALNSLQENIDLFNAVHPYTVGLQSVIVLVMLEALLDGSGPISGTVSLFKNLMKKWKARVLGGKLSADEGQSFIEEYEKLSASLPTGKRNFLKASLNKMEQAAKAGDKSKLGAIATEVKNYLARNSSEVKEEQEYIERLESALESIAEAMECSVEDLLEDLLEDVQTPQRKAEGEKDIKNLKGTYKRRIKKAAGTPLNSKASDDAMTRANDTLTDLSNRTAKNDTERRSTELYGKGGKIVKKATVKEEQTAQLSPDLTRTILSVVKEGQAYSGDPPYSGVERRAKSGPNQRATKGSSRTEYNHSEGEYRPSGEQDRYYAKQRAEAKAKKTTTVKEERVGLINLKRKP